MTRSRARIATFLLLAAISCGGEDGGRLIVVGDTAFVHYEAGSRRPAAPAEGESLKPGPPIDRTLLQGKVGVVHFWGTWCGPCRREQPLFVRLAKRYADRGVQFLGVDSRRDSRAQAIAFWDEFEVPYPSIFDPPSQVAFKWGVIPMPQTFVVDKQGKIAAAFNGAVEDEAALAKVLDEELRA